MYLPTLDKLQRYIDVLESLDAEFRSRGIPAKGLVRQDLEEVDEDDAVGEVLDEVIDLEVPRRDLVVEPFGEGLGWSAVSKGLLLADKSH